MMPSKLVAVWCAVALAAVAAGEIRLAENGKTDYTIVAPENPSRDDESAVRDLREYLTRITGATFTVNTDAPHKIYVGRKAPGDKKPLGFYERRVRSENGDIYLYGGGNNGGAFAVYDFLEKFFDCRWYTFYGDECIPEKKTAVFPDLALDVIPSFNGFIYYGSVYTQENATADLFRLRSRIYDRRHKYAAAVPVLGDKYGHTPSQMIPSGLVPMGARKPVYGPLEYFKDRAYFKTNPDFYALDRGGRRNWKYQLCYSNPELRRELVGNYIYVVEKEYRGGPAIVIVDLNDKGKAGMPTCWCENCAALIRKYGDPAGPYWDFVLEMSRIFKEKYPGIMLRVSAYQMTREVPTKFDKPLPDNILVSLAPLDEMDFLKPYEVNSPAACRMIEKWGKIAGGRFCVQTYPTVYPRPLFTYPLVANIDRAVRNIRYLYKHGVSEMTAEFGCGPQGDVGFNELRVYLFASLGRDVNADADALIRDFTEHYYGPAAAPMRKYLAELEACEKNEKNFLRWWPDHRSALTYLTPENLLRWQGYFDEMEKLTGDDRAANLHVRRARTNLDEATMSVWYKFAPGTMPDRDSILKRYDRAVLDSTRAIFADYKPVEGPKITPRKLAGYRRRSMYYHYMLAGRWKTLTGELAKLPAADVKRTVPYINKKELSPAPDAPTGIAAKGELPEAFDFVLSRWAAPPVEFRYRVDTPLKPEQLKADAGKGYRYHYLGTTRLYPDCLIGLNFIYAGGVTLGYLYDPAHPEQRYDIYLALKLDADGKTLWCGEAVLVKSDRSETLGKENLFKGTYPVPYERFNATLPHGR